MSQLLPSFEPSANVAVIGASGGIGSAFVRLLAADASVTGGFYAWDGKPIAF